MINPKILNNVRLIQKCIVVDSAGRILALLRNANDHSRGGHWDLPGGGYEEGEDVIDSIKREVYEEVSLVAKNVSPILFVNNSAKTGFFQGDNVFGICYVCRDWSGEVVLSQEHSEYRWVTPNELLTHSFGEDGGFFAASLSSYISSLPSSA